MRLTKLLQTHPTLTQAESLSSLCVPLRKLGIVYFSHAHIDAKSTMATIGLCPGFFELYFTEGYHQYDLHMANLPQGESLILWDHVGIKKQTKEMHQAFTSFNQGHTFSIVYKHGKEIDCYHFAGILGETGINNRYFQLIDQLRAFINFFTDKVAENKSLRIAYTKRIPVAINAGEYCLETPSVLENIQAFTSELDVNKYYYERSKYLTKRELECLHWIAMGKTIEETALILSISPRTAKAHITQAKTKLGCRNLFQLGLKYAQIQSSI